MLQEAGWKESEIRVITGTISNHAVYVMTKGNGVIWLYVSNWLLYSACNFTNSIIKVINYIEFNIIDVIDLHFLILKIDVKEW